MKKQEFITMLHYKLSSLPEGDVLERLGFITEMIDDRIEEGYTEEDAIRALGPIDDLAARIISEANGAPKAVKPTEAAKKKNTALVITLIAIGSPLWISLGAAALSLVVAAYAVIWSIAGSLWAVFGALAGAGAGGIIVGCALTFSNPAGGLAILGCALFSLGISLPAFYGCLYSTKGAAWLSKQIAIGIKNIFAKR